MHNTIRKFWGGWKSLVAFKEETRTCTVMIIINNWWIKSDELLPSIKKKTEFYIGEIKTNPQETLEYKRNKPTEAPSFDIPLKLEEAKWLLCSNWLEVFDSLFSKAEKLFNFALFTDG